MNSSEVTRLFKRYKKTNAGKKRTEKVQIKEQYLIFLEHFEYRKIKYLYL